MQKIQSAYVDSKFHLDRLKNGCLSGLKFAVKDVFQICGYQTGLGNPSWKSDHPAAIETAPVICKLLDHGADLQGITISDEFMFSIKGSNSHYGEPLNPRHPDCYTGGSSSGSASVVAQKLVDFALGTDTGGSIRVPGSYCGLFGFRPTYSKKLLSGVAPLASSFDTVGVLSYQADVIEKVGKLLYLGKKKIKIKHIYYLDNEIIEDINFDYQQVIQQIANLFKITPIEIKPLRLPFEFNLEHLQKMFKRIQGYEAWKNYGNWVTSHRNFLGSDIAAHFEYAAGVRNDTKLLIDYQQQHKFSSFLTHLLGEDSLLLLPTTVSVAPAKSLSFSTIEKLRTKTQYLTSIAGVAGTPQLVVPLQKGGQDFSLSIIANRNTDNYLLQQTSLIFKAINKMSR